MDPITLGIIIGIGLIAAGCTDQSLPEDPSTFPNRTAQYAIPVSRPAAIVRSSPKRFVSRSILRSSMLHLCGLPRRPDTELPADLRQPEQSLRPNPHQQHHQDPEQQHPVS